MLRVASRCQWIMRRAGWDNNVLWASRYVSAEIARILWKPYHRQLASWSEHWTEYQWDCFSPSFFYLCRSQDGGRSVPHNGEVWEMVLLVFWQSSSGQEQCHLMLLESPSERKGRVSLNGNFSKETWDVPSRKLSGHLSGLLRIPTVSDSPTTITRPR